MTHRLLAAALALAIHFAPIALAADTTPSKAPHIGPWGFDLAGRDLSVRPGRDFNLHASGSYVRNTPIPSDKVMVGAFVGLHYQSQDQLLAIIREQAATPVTPDGVRIGNLFRSFMDEARIEALDDKPLQSDLDRVRVATTPEAQARLMGDSQGRAGGSFFASEVQEDLKNPNRSALYLGLAGLGLPDRDYYLAEGFAPVRKAYQDYLAQVLAAIGWPDAQRAAADVWALELRIAGVHWSRAEKRETGRIYNPMTLSELDVFAPGFPWHAWAEGAGVAQVARFIVIEKDAFPALAKIFAETPVATLQAWQAAQTTDQSSPYLSKRFSDQHFAFRGRILQGQQTEMPREKRGVQVVDAQLGDPLGRLYVARHFPPEAKAATEELVAMLRKAMMARIGKLEWMSRETRKQALYKMRHFGVKIGYPDHWRDFSGLELSPDDLHGNMIAAGRFNYAWNLAKLDRRIDPAEWGMNPQQVNAYYNPVRNEIVFPAAILQPPFFDPHADAAVNFGGIGAVIGHEITHGFDDQGRKYDGDGVLRDWWSPEDSAEFMKRAAALSAQYSAIEVLPGANVKGDLTLGENIADLGGILLALDAYRLSLDGKPAPVLDGLTGEQRVFYGWAQVWRAITRDELTRQLLATDTHSPSSVRARAPMRNVDAWYEAFDVQPGDADYVPPEQRVRIW